jgi:DNA polymerase-1
MKISLEQAEYWSSFQKICVDIRARGIRVDIPHIKKSIVYLNAQIESIKAKIHETIPDTVSLDSPVQLSKILSKLGYILPKTEKGHDSVAKGFLEENKDDELIGLILKYRTHKKILGDFFEKILDMQQYTCPEALVEGAKYGRVYPELNVFGAATGRFSSSCPNIQQIPKRDEHLGHMSRAIFIPDSETWYSLDWSNQEGRLQIHYASLIKASGIESIVQDFRTVPTLDMHQKIANLAHIERSHAKTINLGLSYGMGKEKLCKALKMPLKQAEQLIEKYHKLVPFLKQLTKECERRLKIRGYIQTIGNRKLVREGQEFDYKALNRLIQGSAADQCMMAMKAAYDAGLNIICVVHDEFNIEGTEQDALSMQKIMENVLQLNVPMVAEISSGRSWGELAAINHKKAA